MNGNDQSSNSIAELQNRLRVIGRVNANIPPVSIDGIYGPETTQAVRSFQSEYGLEVTGRVDLATWEAIDREYRKAARDFELPGIIRPYRECRQNIRLGDTSDIVYILQVMLRAIGRIFENIEEVNITGAYDPLTGRAVAQFQAASGLAPSGEVDRATWDIIARLYNKYFERLC